jgi:probable phosphoglycerate mutase
VAAHDPASTCRVVIARHGQSVAVEDGDPVYSHHPVGLTPRGHSQARRLASSLEPARLDAVYTSDLNRARETAKPVAEAQGLAPVVVPELREISLGDFEGMTLAQVHAEHAEFVPWLEVSFNGSFPSDEFHHPADLVFPGGESVAMVYERTIESFLRIVRAHLGGTIAVIGHGWVLQPILCHVISAPIRNYFRLQLPYAAPTLIEVDADGIGVLEVLNGGTGVLDGEESETP